MVPFCINIHFGSNEPEDFGLDLVHFPLELQNNITNEELWMEMDEDNSFFIERAPNDIVDWEWLKDYFHSIWKIPSISIGKWV